MRQLSLMRCCMIDLTYEHSVDKMLEENRQAIDLNLMVDIIIYERLTY